VSLRARREHLFVERAEAALSALPDERRAALARAVAALEVKVRAARALLDADCPDEAAAAAREAAARCDDALAIARRDADEPFEETVARWGARGLPVLWRDAPEPHRGLARADAAARAFAWARLDPAGRAARRRWRMAGMGALVAGSCALAAAALRPETRTLAEASATFADSDECDAARVMDGDRKTEWLLPDREGGWIELRFPRPRAVRSVELWNAHNRQYNDRATQRWRVELYRDTRLVGSAEGAFVAPPGERRAAVAVQGSEVTRVRVSVLAHHGFGGGLAEVIVR